MVVIRKDIKRGALILSLEGRLDHENSIVLREMIDDYLTKECTRVVLNLEQVDYLSISGLRFLLELNQRLDLAQRFLRLVIQEKRIRDVIELTGSQKELVVFTSEEEALKP